MNEQARKILAEILQRILDGVDATVAFGKEQLPDVLQQLLTWHFVESLVYFSASLIATLICLWYIGYVLTRKPIEDTRNFWFFSSGDRTGNEAIAAIPGSIAMLTIAGVFLNLDWLKIWLAPKLYLLEYGSTLIK